MIEPGPGNLVSVTVPFDIDGDNIEYVVDPKDIVIQPTASQPNDTEGGQTVEEAFVALSAEHDTAIAANKKLVDERNQARARILQLEDQLGSGFPLNFHRIV